MWDAAAVKRYEQWFETPYGSFALKAEYRLISYLISSWPRRGKKLLEIGCGPAIFLERFWDAGFAVTGLDSSPAMLEAARARIGCRADLHLGQADHLPFDDNQFDYAALLTVLEFCEDPELALSEASRVASKGLLITHLNRASLYYLAHGLPLPFLSGSLRQATWFGSSDLRQRIRLATEAKKIACASVLPGPMCSWRRAQPWRFLNSRVYPGAFGSYVGFRAEFMPARVKTPLMALKPEPSPT